MSSTDIDPERAQRLLGYFKEIEAFYGSQRALAVSTEGKARLQDRLDFLGKLRSEMEEAS